MKTSKLLSVITVILISIILSSCGKDLPVKNDLSGKSYELINQDSAKVEYPEIATKKVTVIGYIYTHCPDICPLTTNNMRLIQEELKEQGLNDQVQFITVSFDPERDTPSVLKDYARVRNLDLANWTLLTGEEKIVEEVLRQDGVIAAVSDSSKKTGSYYIAHTDRISLMDDKKKIRAHYKGSEASINKVIEDIKLLID
jgi:protein SCO1/2